MRKKFSFAWSGALMVAALLVGCGGGGGGGGLPILPVAVVPPTTPAAPVGAVRLTGTATYESVPNPDGTLVYASTSVKPVRGATVEVLDANAAPLATTTTDDGGAYAVSVPANTTISVRVRAQLSRTGVGPSWDVSVRDNTQANGLYAMQSSPFSSGASASVRDLRAATGWGGSSYTGTRVAAPFAVLDTVYAAMQKVLTVAPATAFPALRVYWSPNNRPSVGSLAIGQIGTTFFIGRNAGREIYVLGAENVDTDEFDDSVIAHEWGHYYQSSFSRDDSPGGAHSPRDRVDRRLAFSEGWGNGWSGIALGRSNYTDSAGAQQAEVALSTNIDLSTGPSTPQGWYREASVQTIFWNLNQQVGFKPIHDAMAGILFRSGAPVTSIHPFTAAFNATTPASASALAGLLSAQSISAAANDPYGEAERNDGGQPVVANVLPMYGEASVGGAPSRACVSNTAGSDNRLGSFAYLRFSVPADGSYQFTVAGGPPAANPDFDIYRGGLITRTGSKLSLAAGPYVLVVRDLNNSGASTCFNVAIQ